MQLMHVVNYTVEKVKSFVSQVFSDVFEHIGLPVDEMFETKKLNRI